MFFSIITVTKDNLEGLKATQRSLDMQTCRDFEWVVMDGGSEDGTWAFLDGVDAQWVSEADQGIYDAMNKGLARAKGQYVLFLNAGDALATEEALEALRDLALVQKPDFMYGDSFEMCGTKKMYKKAKPFFDDLPLFMMTHHQSMLYKCDVLGDLRYDLSYEIAADYDLTCRFLQRSKVISYAAFPISIFQEGGVSQTQASKGRREQFQIREKFEICSKPVNVALYAAQTLRWNLRAFFPRLYWAMDFYLHDESTDNTGIGTTRSEIQLSHPKPQA